MYAFFFVLYSALFTGTFSSSLISANTPVHGSLQGFIHNTANLIMNALGGNFTEVQTYSYFDSSLISSVTGYGYSPSIQLVAHILTIITLCGICFGVLKITKAIFSIFFGGVR